MDRKRLRSIVLDLKRDETARQKCLCDITDELRKNGATTTTGKRLVAQEKVLQHCNRIQMTAEELLKILEDLLEDLDFRR